MDMEQQQNKSTQVQAQFILEGGHLVMSSSQPAPAMSKDVTVNDRDRMQDLLAQEKYLSFGYNTALNEASHDALFQVMKQNHDTVLQCERQIFTAMFDKGWYQMPVADAATVTHAHTQFQEYRTQFPFQQPGQGQSIEKQPMTQQSQINQASAKGADAKVNHATRSH
jgi:spore coat protein CotF